MTDAVNPQSGFSHRRVEWVRCEKKELLSNGCDCRAGEREEGERSEATHFATRGSKDVLAWLDMKKKLMFEYIDAGDDPGTKK